MSLAEATRAVSNGCYEATGRKDDRRRTMQITRNLQDGGR
jgi:hypothetical protein